MYRFITYLFIYSMASIIGVAISKPTCGPVCFIYCEYGNVLDEKGCPTCECVQPCGSKRTPYPNLKCGLTTDSQACPSNYTCITAPDDSYAVCCPTEQRVKTPSQKPSCPVESHFGVCINPDCNTDADCASGQMCCGNCHRRCIDVYIKQDSSENSQNL